MAGKDSILNDPGAAPSPPDPLETTGNQIPNKSDNIPPVDTTPSTDPDESKEEEKQDPIDLSVTPYYRITSTKIDDLWFGGDIVPESEFVEKDISIKRMIDAQAITPATAEEVSKATGRPVTTPAVTKTPKE